MLTCGQVSVGEHLQLVQLLLKHGVLVDQDPACAAADSDFQETLALILREQLQ